MRQRLGLLLAGIILLSMLRFCAGAPTHVVRVDFSIDPGIFTGAEVFIDGKAVGFLRPTGSRNLTGFRVEEGEHTLEIRREGYRSEATRFTAGFGGPGALFADLESRNPDGEPFTTLVLRR